MSADLDRVTVRFGPRGNGDAPNHRPASSGALFLVVGPSGVGKDTLIDGARERLAREEAFVFPRRVVTRPAGSIGEDHEPMDEAGFERADASGEFLVSWRAHGLGYGIRREVAGALEAGQNVVLNVSRTVIDAFARCGAPVVVLSVTASPETVRRRLAARGREDAAAVAARLSRRVALDGPWRLIEIPNDGDVATGVARFVDALLGAATLPLRLVRAALEMPGERLCILHAESLPVSGRRLAGATMVEVSCAGARLSARLVLTRDERLVGRGAAALSADAFERLGAPEGAAVLVRRARQPASRDALRRKIAGQELGAADIGRIVGDIVEGRYAPAETAGFLVAASTNLTAAEVAALTAARAELFERLDWGGRIVADKHSMGGVPGGRITMVVVPILAAHGLLVPKTSSRAITSAAGTADVMECLARVDLSPGELKAVVERAGGAVAWSRRVSHGPMDDVMTAINRPLGIRSASLDVSSILSKKVVVGATHVMVDVPFGPGTKTRTRAGAESLARLFETVGAAVGLNVRGVVTDGSRPIGRGVGPALELADVMAVLAGDPAAPPALADKAVDVAGLMLEWDPAVPMGTGRARARALLAAGAALEAFERIVDAQGRCATASPGPFVRTVEAPRAGLIAAVDGFALSGLARRAGAPQDKGAGLRLRRSVGERVRAGDPLLDIVAGSADGLERAGTPDPADAFTLLPA